MCGGRNLADDWLGINPPGMPAPVSYDPAGDKLRAEAEATARSNQERAQRRKAARASSLLATGGGQPEAATASVLAYGKTQMGS